jgi:ATP-dependent DNA helicase RecQ
VVKRTSASVDDVAGALFDFDLRPSQRRAIEAVTAGRDTLAVLPTGSGKSAIYQVSGLALGGLTVVVSPLIALQRDQLRGLAGRAMPNRGPVRAAILNSSQRHADRLSTLQAVTDGQLDFVLLGPEQLANEETQSALATRRGAIGLFVVDEAHLVSEWGQDFRPEYLRLADLAATVGAPALLALTATASPPVQADITRRLRMRRAEIVVADFDRPNISLAVRRSRPALPEAQAIDDRCVEVLLEHDTPALVYALTHARCESLADRLRLDAFRAAAYHAGLSSTQRMKVQDDFFAGRLDVVVATSAFGMGIDKPDIRTVVHAGVPASLDEYYQEIGRAGRDGQPAAAALVHDPRTLRVPRLLASREQVGEQAVRAVVDALEDAAPRVALSVLASTSGASRHVVDRIMNELMELGLVAVRGGGANREVTVLHPLQAPAHLNEQLASVQRRRQAILASRINVAREYAETPQCRRAELLAYFGEHYEPPCNNCDNDNAFQPSVPQAEPVTAGTPIRHRLWGDGMLLSRDDHEIVAYFNTVGYRHLTTSSFANGILRYTTPATSALGEPLDVMPHDVGNAQGVDEETAEHLDADPDDSNTTPGSASPRHLRSRRARS